MKKSLRRLFSLSFLSVSLLVLSGCGEAETVPYQITLEVWGTFDDSDAFNKVAADYGKINPYVKEVIYRKLPPETYKEDLINAMASGTGPDIFMIKNTWGPSFADKAVPAPIAIFSEKVAREAFVDVVIDDFLNAEKQMLAAPLSVDSLALYYNKDIFNAVGIAAPPKTWEELIAMIPILTRVDDYGNINQSAVALGTGDNVNRSSDILLNLMMQFDSSITDTQFADQADQQALDFYTRFARLGLPTYTWNQRQHYSIDAFYEGTLGMMLNYSYHYPTIRQKNAKLNFAVAPLPQFKDKVPVNFANYWGFTVARNKTQAVAKRDQQVLSPDNYQKARINESWQFLNYLTLPHPTNTIRFTNIFSGEFADVALTFDPAKDYLEFTKKPAARRDLIEMQKGDPVLAPYATGNLVAKSWKPGNTEQAEGLLVDTINIVNRGERSITDALAIFGTRFMQQALR